MELSVQILAVKVLLKVGSQNYYGLSNHAENWGQNQTSERSGSEWDENHVGEGERERVSEWGAFPNNKSYDDTMTACRTFNDRWCRWCVAKAPLVDCRISQFCQWTPNKLSFLVIVIAETSWLTAAILQPVTGWYQVLPLVEKACCQWF